MSTRTVFALDSIVPNLYKQDLAEQLSNKRLLTLCQGKLYQEVHSHVQQLHASKCQSKRNLDRKKINCLNIVQEILLSKRRYNCFVLNRTTKFRH